MNSSKMRFSSILILILSVILTSCAPSQVNAATANSQNPPVVSTTAVPSAQTANTAPATIPSSAGLKFNLVPANSEASFAVREQLAQRNLPSDAVGKTKAVSGAIVLNPDGSVDSGNSKFVVDVTNLQTDSSMRDNYVRRNILQTSQFPQVVFVPTRISGLTFPIPQSGPVTFQLTGNLTIRDVTRPVTWEVTGSITSGEATGTATTSFTFEDFNLPQPKVPVVLSVVDKINLSLTLDLQPAAQ
jgi:polyisoprenoid-binding protein YceI